MPAGRRGCTPAFDPPLPLVTYSASTLAAAIHPNHAILGEPETMLLLEINDGSHTRGESQDG